MEKRNNLIQAPEVRKDDNGVTATGYAAVFNSDTDIGGYFTERISPGAFTQTLEEDDILALVDHDRGRVIGRSSAGTLRLKEDNRGLHVEIDLPDTTDGRDLQVSLARGDISGMSFGFQVFREEWDETGDVAIRTILGARVFEVSAVAFPAYEDTEIALRSLKASRAKSNFQSAALRLQRKAHLDLIERKAT